MKTRSLLLLTVLFAASFVSAQPTDCSDLLISEYLEGGNNNKALEIYNASLSPISLANYRIIRWDNGSITSDQTPEGVLELPDNITLQPHAVYVMALNLIDPTGTGQNAPIDTALQNRADTLLCPGCATGTGLPRVLCFNGDDALSLEKNVGGSWIKIDIFGSIGERPLNSSGSSNPTGGWTSIPPYSSIPPNYDSSVQGPYFLQYWSQDNTLIRKTGIKKGVSTNPAPETFNPSVEWDSLPENTYTNLRWHDCECNLLGLSDHERLLSASLYPNPANQTLNIALYDFSGEIRFYTTSGQLVLSKQVNRTLNNAQIDVSPLTSGTYFVEMREQHADGSLKAMATKKFIVQR